MKCTRTILIAALAAAAVFAALSPPPAYTAPEEKAEKITLTLDAAANFPETGVDYAYEKTIFFNNKHRIGKAEGFHLDGTTRAKGTLNFARIDGELVETISRIEVKVALEDARRRVLKTGSLKMEGNRGTITLAPPGQPTQKIEFDLDKSFGPEGSKTVPEAVPFVGLVRGAKQAVAIGTRGGFKQEKAWDFAERDSEISFGHVAEEDLAGLYLEAVVLPEKPVAIGGSWEAELPVKFNGPFSFIRHNRKVKTKYTLNKIIKGREIGGRRVDCYEIHYRGVFESDGFAGAHFAAPEDTRPRLINFGHTNYTITGWYYLSVEGLLLEEVQTEVKYSVGKIYWKIEEKVPEDKREYIEITNYIGVAPPKSDKKASCRIWRK